MAYTTRVSPRALAAITAGISIGILTGGVVPMLLTAIC